MTQLSSQRCLSSLIQSLLLALLLLPSASAVASRQYPSTQAEQSKLRADFVRAMDEATQRVEQERHQRAIMARLLQNAKPTKIAFTGTDTTSSSSSSSNGERQLGNNNGNNNGNNYNNNFNYGYNGYNYNYNNNQYQNNGNNYNNNYNNNNNNQQQQQQDENAYADYGGLDLTKYALKYLGCQNIHSFSDEMAGDEDASSPLQMNRFVVFRLCPKDTCSNYNSLGCDYNYGEYTLPMEDYLAVMQEYHVQQYQTYCKTCYLCMTGKVNFEAGEDYENMEEEDNNNNNNNNNGQNRRDLGGYYRNNYYNSNGGGGAQYYNYNKNSGYYQHNYQHNYNNNKNYGYQANGNDDQAAAANDDGNYNNGNYNNGNYYNGNANGNGGGDDNYGGGNDDGGNDDGGNDDGNGNDDANNYYADPYANYDAYPTDDQFAQASDANETDYNVNCVYNDVCYEYRAACESDMFGNNNYMAYSDNYAAFFECGEFDVGGTVSYVGPHCRSDGFTIGIGIYEDEYCTSYVSDMSEMEKVTGQLFSDDYLRPYYPKQCISCMASESYDLMTDDEVNQENGGVYEVCGYLYQQSAKCNRYMSAQQTYQGAYAQEANEEDVCNFVESLIENNYDEYGEAVLESPEWELSKWKQINAYKQDAQAATPLQILGLLFSVGLCAVLMVYSVYLRFKLSRRLPWSKDVGKNAGAGYAGHIARNTSGITMQRSMSNLEPGFSASGSFPYA